jgi:hypothetical protein
MMGHAYVELMVLGECIGWCGVCLAFCLEGTTIEAMFQRSTLARCWLSVFSSVLIKCLSAHLHRSSRKFNYTYVIPLSMCSLMFDLEALKTTFTFWTFDQGGFRFSSDSFRSIWWERWVGSPKKFGTINVRIQVRTTDRHSWLISFLICAPPNI